MFFHVIHVLRTGNDFLQKLYAKFVRTRLKIHGSSLFRHMYKIVTRLRVGCTLEQKTNKIPRMVGPKCGDEGNIFRFRRRFPNVSSFEILFLFRTTLLRANRPRLRKSLADT